MMNRPIIDKSASPTALERVSRATPYRVDGALAYVVGDIHGRYDLLKLLLAEIVRDATATAAGRRSILVFLGDYIDRGPQSAEVLDALIWIGRRPEFELHMLRGNHEQAMLEFLSDPIRAEAWLWFGGVETLASYDVQAPLPDDKEPETLRRTRDNLLDQLPASHFLLLQKLPVMLTLGDYVFVHAGIRPGVPLAKQNELDLLWIREKFLEWSEPHEKMVVHGHTWKGPDPDILPHRLGLDTGAYSTGVLTAARVEDFSLEILQVHSNVADHQRSK